MGKSIRITGEQVSMIVDSILYGDDTGFEDVLENGYDALEKFSETMRESGKVFTINTDM